MRNNAKRRRRRRTKRILQIIVMLFSLFMLIVVAGLAYLDMRPMVVSAVVIEAGTPDIDVNEFLLEKDKRKLRH